MPDPCRFEIRGQDEHINVLYTSLKYVLHISSVGSGAYAICWNENMVPGNGSAPAGVGVCSFTAEVIAAERALQKSIRTSRGWMERTNKDLDRFKEPF